MHERLHMIDPDPFAMALNAKLGITRRADMLYLVSEMATLHPEK